MEIENTETQGPVTTETEAPDSVEAPASTEPDGSEQSASTEGGEEQVTPPVAPAFEPNFKYKFDGQEKELDEWLRPVIKDPETQQKLIDIVQRAQAHEKYKPKIPDYERVVSTVNDLSEKFEKGDHESVLEALGYTDDMLFQIARQKLERSKWTPEQRAVFDEKKKIALEKDSLQRETEFYRSEATRGLIERTGFELDTELGKAEYQPLVSAYEKANGSGSFKRMVIQRGAQMVAAGGNQHIPPSQLLQTVAGDFKPFLSAMQAQAVTAIPGTRPKVISNVGTGTSSPGKKQFNSIEDLKKHRKTLVGDND